MTLDRTVIWVATLGEALVLKCTFKRVLAYESVYGLDRPPNSPSQSRPKTVLYSSPVVYHSSQHSPTTTCKKWQVCFSAQPMSTFSKHIISTWHVVCFNLAVSGSFTLVFLLAVSGSFTLVFLLHNKS